MAVTVLRRFYTKNGTLQPALRAVLYLLAFVVALYGVSLLAMFIAVYVFGARTPSEEPNAGTVYLSLTAPVCAVLLAITFRRFLDNRSIPSLGITSYAGWWKILALGALVGVLIQLSRLAWSYFHGSPLFEGTALSRPTDVGSPYPLFAAALLIGSLVSMNVVFRGYVLQNVWEQWGALAALIVSTILSLLSGFSFAFPQIVDVGLMTLYLGLTVLWTRSLWLAIGFNIAWDLLGPFFHESTTDLAFDVVGIAITCALTYYLYRRGWLPIARDEDYQVAAKTRAGLNPV